MFKIFISNATRERILQEEAERKKKTLIYRMLCWNNGNLVEILSDAAMNEYKSNPKKVLDNPSSLYILDIPEKEAADIQRKYGVMCASGKNPNVSSLLDINDIFSPKPGEKKYNGWDKVLDSVEKLPSNAILISDRYVFSRNDIKNGIHNIQKILDELLPLEFEGGDYHVAVIFSLNDIDNRLSFDVIDERLNNVIKNVKMPHTVLGNKSKAARNYPIMLEVLGITNKCTIFKESHPRRIVSNYYYVQAEHKLSAFDIDLMGTVKQSIIPMALFTKSGLADRSTLPLEFVEETIETFKQFNSDYANKQLRDTELFYSYSMNGEPADPCPGLQNRLLK
jgi:hypothetical protein